MQHTAILITGVLLLIGIVNTVPMPEPGDQDMEETPLATRELPQDMEDAPSDTEEGPFDEDNFPQDPEELPWNTEIPQDNTTMIDDGDGAMPSDFFLKEVSEYFKLQSKNPLTRERRQSGDTINQGDTIALQSFCRKYWLSCRGSQCQRNSCPRVYMSSNDWTHCYGEVFQIYRASGPGIVRSGDLVGLYYPQGRSWIGCPGNGCNKSTCPGRPTAEHGFASDELWYRCYGQVFKMYAIGKGLGAVVNRNDDVAFFYLQDQLWVSQGDHWLKYTWKKSCLGTSRPPAMYRYDWCSWEHLNIKKKLN